ncbi:hypothetical protein [Zhongshania sp. BJYM1]|uniref:hypothetical protein n=1 Tax=Zhongshania aquatica TaxID=2965069 RepID=UPI0022B5D4C2|nr:hypothetical protein [Marortus sp. BJYM1]
MSRIKCLHLPLLAVAVSLAACNDDNKSSSGASAEQQSVVVAPSLGLIRNARIKIFQADGTTLLGEGTSADDGTVDVSYLNYTGPVVIEVLGGGSAIYYDESLKQFAALPASATVRAIAVLPAQNLAVTPLTNLAYEIAKARSSATLTAADVANINEQVRLSLAPGISSILAVPELLSSATGAKLGDTDAGKHALVLAALADLSSGNASPALNTLLAMATDGADGSLDGLVDGSSITVPYGDFIADMAAALSRQANTYGNAALKASAADQKPSSATVEEGDTGGSGTGGTGGSGTGGTGGTGGSGTGGTGGTGGSGTGGTGGTGGSGTGGTGGTGGSGTGGTGGTGGSGTGGTGGTGGSGTGGTGGTGGSGTGGTGGNTDPALNNEGKGRFTGDGFTGDVNGVTYTYTDSVNVLPNNTDKTQFYIEGRDASALSKWRVVIPNAVGTYNCDDSGDDTVLQHLNQGGLAVNSGAGSNDGDCIVKVLQVGSVYEGYFIGNLYGAVGTPLKPVTNGYFYATSEVVDTGGGGGNTGGGTDGGVSGDLNNAVYDSLNGRNGATVSFVGSAESYNLGVADVGSGFGLRGLDFYVDRTRDVNTTLFQEAYPSYLEVDITNPVLGEQDCGDELKIRLNMAGGTNSGRYSASACKMRLDYASDIGGLQGVILSATLVTTSDTSPTFELINTPFRIYHHVGTAGALSGDLPLDKFGSIEIGDGGTFELGDNQYFLLENRVGLGGTSPDDGSPAFTGNASDVISLVTKGHPSSGFAGDTTYNCGTEYRSRAGGLELAIKVGTYLLETRYSSANNVAANCQIVTVGRGGRYYDASYTATLISNDTSLEESLRTLPVTGEFRNYAVRLNRPEGGVDDEGALSSEEVGATLQIEDGSPDWQTGDRFKFLEDQFDRISVFDTSYGISIDRGERVMKYGVEVLNAPRAVGVYDCASINPDNSRIVNVAVNAVGVKYETTTYDSVLRKTILTPGAACQIEIVSDDDGFVNGTYTATAVVVGGEQIMPGGDNTVRVSGTFRRKIEPAQQ